jgi:outer membrane protein assembly factor BamB
MAWTEPHVLTVFASGTAFAVDINTLKVVKSLAISTEPTYHYTSFGGGRYLVWGNGKRKIIGIFDTQEFSIKWMVSLPAIPSEVLVNEGRLLIGGEDGLLYAYSINGVI